MDRAIKLGVVAGSLALLTNQLGWTDPFHLIAGGVLLAILLLAAVAWKRRRALAETEPADHERIRDGFLRSVVLGLLYAGACALWLATGFWGLEQVRGFADPDHDRTELEKKIADLAAEGRHDRVAALLRERLQSQTSPAWQADLAEQLLRHLLKAGHQCQDLTGRVERFAEAEAVARQYGLDDLFAGKFLAEARRHCAFPHVMEELRQACRWPDLVSEVQAAMRNSPPSEWHHPLAEWLYDGLIEWAKSCPDPAEQQHHFRQALAAAEKHGLKKEPATSLLMAVQQRVQEGKERVRLEAQVRDFQARLQEMEEQQARNRKREEDRNRPAALPPGAAAELVRVAAQNFPPVLVLEVAVVRADDTAIADLKEKDFRVTFAGKSARVAALARIHRETPASFVVLALDISGSTKGEPLEEAKDGSKAFLAGLAASQTWIRVLTFEEQLRWLGDWTRNFPEAAMQLDPLTAQGATALHKAVAAGLDELRPKKGHKQIVVFTDGKDTVGGPTLEQVIIQCRQEAVTVHAICLRTPDLDAAAIQKLARETGGEYLEAAGPSEIRARFRKTAQRLQPSCYRLAVVPDEAKGFLVPGTPLTLTVGGANQVTLSATVPIP